MTLNKRDVQLFFKRLRKYHAKQNNRSRVKYYLCGEYGGRTKRPHYHAIIFGVNEESCRKCWTSKTGQIGSLHFGTVTGASIGYTLKYMCKPHRIPQFRGDDRIPEFSLMSKGLGLNYLSDEMVQWHKNDLNSRMYVPIEDGKKIAMPRYYKDKIYTDAERKKIGQVQKQRADLIPEPDEAQKVAVIKMRHDKFFKNQRLNEKL